ncbi:MAG TPA: glutamate racemase [Candidatus Absconditabacterales bacterium]|nr:glutamate racemase [Candidatus Absconditabacterales bacterium]
MIGIFDSGFGGLQTLTYFQKNFPEHDFILLADNLHAPYGVKSPDEIQTLTFRGLHWLFDHGAKIVILACNTASAYAIRNWQTTYPNKKVLSVSIPGVEAVIEGKYSSIGILATDATVQSGIFEKKFQELMGQEGADIHIVAAPELVTMIEAGCTDEKKIETVIKNYLEKLPSKIEVLLLGCTHFPVYETYFKRYFSGAIVDPAQESALKFVSYLKRHNDIAVSLGLTKKMEMFTTGDTKTFDRIGEAIVHYPLKSKRVIVS